MAIEAFSVLQVKLVFCIFGSILCGCLIVWILTKIEQQKSSLDNFPPQVDHKGDPFPNDLQLEHEKVDDDDDSTVSGLSKIQNNRQRQENKLQLILNCGMVAILMVISYALLVVSEARIWLSLLAEVSALGLFLRTQIQDEIRRQRVDRLLGILTLFLFTVSFLSISTYCRLGLQEGEIYQGPARIIGYDQTNYEKQNGRISQSDLEVAWGGIWGCKNENIQCNAIVSGAMCQEDDRRRRRTEGDGGDGNEEGGDTQEEVAEAQEEVAEAEEEVEEAKEEEADVEEEAQEEEDAIEDEAEEYVEEVIDETDEEIDEYYDEVADEAEDAETEEEELDQEDEELDEVEEEKEELKEENQELQEEVNAMGGAVEEEFEEEAEEVDEGEVYYEIDDDYYDGEYWDGIWGEYTCSDLFDKDIEGMEYDADEPPGEDEWPFVNIYGNCDTCEAFLDDYYTSEHFNGIKKYKTQGQYYSLAAVGCVVATIVFACQHHMHPEPDNEIELLPNGAVVA